MKYLNDEVNKDDAETAATPIAEGEPASDQCDCGTYTQETCDAKLADGECPRYSEDEEDEVEDEFIAAHVEHAMENETPEFQARVREIVKGGDERAAGDIFAQVRGEVEAAKPKSASELTVDELAAELDAPQTDDKPYRNADGHTGS